MTTFCDTNLYEYIVRHTDSTLGVIVVPKMALDSSELDIALVGKSRLEYGQVFNENILHILENFASPSDLDRPDNFETYHRLLENPVVGQLWYNSKTKLLNICTSINPTKWEPLMDERNFISGNSGFLFDGEEIPLPIGNDGYEYTYDECVWHVSPAFMNALDEPITNYELDSSTGVIHFRYSVDNGDNFIPGNVTYIIIGKRNSQTSRF